MSERARFGANALARLTTAGDPVLGSRLPARGGCELRQPAWAEPPPHWRSWRQSAQSRNLSFLTSFLACAILLDTFHRAGQDNTLLYVLALFRVVESKKGTDVVSSDQALVTFAAAARLNVLE